MKLSTKVWAWLNEPPAHKCGHGIARCTWDSLCEECWMDQQTALP